MHFTFAEVGLPDGLALHGRDLWAARDLGVLKGSYTAESVPSHGVVMLVLKP